MKDLITISKDISDFENLVSKFFPSVLNNFFLNEKTINVDLIEEDDKIILEAEVPGVEKEDINVDISPNGIMTISYNKVHESRDKKGKYYRKEIRSGSYSRSFDIDLDSVDIENIKATYKNGILKLEIPKAKNFNKKSRKISIE